MSELNRSETVEEQRIIPFTQIEKWIDVDGRFSYPAFFGTSLQRLDALTQTGTLPGSPIRFPWQKELTAEFPNLYYFYPHLENLRRMRLDIASGYDERMKNNEFGWQDILINTMNSAQFYAINRVLVDGFQQKFGQEKSIDTILELANVLLPNEFQQQTEFVNILEAGAKEEINRAHELLPHIDTDKVKDLLRPLMKRRGFLVFLTHKIGFDKNTTIHLGVEHETELMVTSKYPLTSSFIGGISPITEYDKEDLLRLYGEYKSPVTNTEE